MEVYTKFGVDSIITHFLFTKTCHHYSGIVEAVIRRRALLARKLLYRQGIPVPVKAVALSVQLLVQAYVRIQRRIVVPAVEHAYLYLVEQVRCGYLSTNAVPAAAARVKVYPLSRRITVVALRSETYASTRPEISVPKWAGEI